MRLAAHAGDPLHLSAHVQLVEVKKRRTDGRQNIRDTKDMPDNRLATRVIVAHEIVDRVLQKYTVEKDGVRRFLRGGGKPPPAVFKGKGKLFLRNDGRVRPAELFRAEFSVERLVFILAVGDEI